MTLQERPDDIDPALDMSYWLHPGDEGYPYDEVINDPRPVCSQCSIYDAHEWCVASFMLSYKCHCTSEAHYQNKKGGVL